MTEDESRVTDLTDVQIQERLDEIREDLPYLPNEGVHAVEAEAKALRDERARRQEL